jgi:DNA-binding response OmpR family regulator
MASPLLTVPPGMTSTPWSRSVLIVEDHAGERALLTRVLSAHGFRAFAVASGEEVLRLHLGEKPDVILLDLSLPGMSGWETLERVRERAVYRAVPVVIVTGSEEVADRVKAFLNAAVDYLVKPFEAADLISSLERALEPTTGGSRPS